LDETRIYNRALSPKEVRDLYAWAPGPVLHYKMDENTGTSSTYDSSTNDYTGTLLGVSSSSWVPGVYGSSLDFDGSTTYITATTEDGNLSTNNYTYSTWFYRTSDPGTDVTIMDNRDATSDGVTVKIGDGTPDTVYCEHNSTSINSTTAMVTGKWFHITCTSDGSTVKLYVNGTLENSAADTSAIAESTDFRIGARSYTSPSQYFIGYIDDVRVYNYARTQKQIIEDMNAGNPVGGSLSGSLLLHLSFDEGYGTTANDLSNNNYDGSLTDGPSWYNSAKFGKGIDLDGLDDRIQGFTSDPFEYIGGNLTLSVWVNQDSGENGDGRIISKPWNGGGQYNYELTLNSNDTITFSLFGTSSWDTTTTETIPTGSWTHLVVTVDGETKTVKIYKDGKLIKSDTHDITGWTPSSGDSNISLCIGSLYPYNTGWGGNTDFSFDGKIDELKIYNYALSEDEVKLDYNRGAGIVFGSTSTESDGVTSSNSNGREYCIPGDTSTCNPPVLEYKFDENTGTTSVYDTSGNKITGTINGSMTTSDWVPGVRGSALTFDGSDDNISATDPDTIDFGTGDFTVSYWAYIDSNPTETNPTIFHKGGWTGTTQAGYNSYFDDSLGQLRFRTKYNSTSELANSLYDISGAGNLDTWIHVVGVVDRSGNQDLYVNGTLVDSDDISSLSAQSLSNSENFYIGGVGGTSNNFLGNIDNFRIYDYARTPAQIAWEYNKGAPIAWYKFDKCEGTTIYDSATVGKDLPAGNNGT